jgi:hypothetical protein
VKSIPIRKVKMSSASASSKNGVKGTSYTAGIPGSQVTINLSKDGNHSLVLSREINPETWSSQIRAYRASKASEKSSAPVPAGQRRFPDGWVGPADTPFCKVCWDAGLPVADFNSHFVKDQPGPDGKVVCPTLLAQKCLDCGVAGHTSGYCSNRRYLERERAKREREEYIKQKKASSGGWETVGDTSKPKARIEGVASSSENKVKIQEKPQPKATLRGSGGGAFALLREETSSSEEEEPEVNVKVETPKSVAAVAVTNKPLTWAQRAAAAAAAPAPAPAATRSKSDVCNDTRYQLHVLCERIEMDSRCAKRLEKKVNPREAAANVAAQSSMKRKQDAATVPA